MKNTREQLAMEIRRLLGELQTEYLELRRPARPDLAADRLGQASRTALGTRIESLNGLLERMKLADFDECEECGGAIDHKRLLAVPETRLCFRCKMSIEEAWARRGAARAW